MCPVTMTVEPPAQPPPEKPAEGRFWVPPKSVLGWLAFALTVAFFPLFIVVTRSTDWFLVHAPFFANTAFFPILFVVYIDLTAVINIVLVVRNRERSVLVIFALVVSVAVGLFATAFLVGEALVPGG